MHPIYLSGARTFSRRNAFLDQRPGAGGSSLGIISASPRHHLGIISWPRLGTDSGDATGSTDSTDSTDSTQSVESADPTCPRILVPGAVPPRKNFWRQVSPLGSSGHPRLQNRHKRCFWDSRRPKFLQSCFKACSKLVQSLSKASPKLLHRHPPSGRGPVCVTRSPKIEKYPYPDVSIGHT